MRECHYVHRLSDLMDATETGDIIHVMKFAGGRAAFASIEGPLIRYGIAVAITMQDGTINTIRKEDGDSMGHIGLAHVNRGDRCIGIYRCRVADCLFCTRECPKKLLGVLENPADER